MVKDEQLKVAEQVCKMEQAMLKAGAEPKCIRMNVTTWEMMERPIRINGLVVIVDNSYADDIIAMTGEDSFC